MGDLRIVIEAAGPHGCSRDVKDGGHVYGCGSLHCPDCLSREFVSFLKTKGMIISKAMLTHWPSDMKDRSYTMVDEVRDDLLTGVRSGSF